MNSKLLFGDCAELRSEKVDPKSSQESYYIGLEHIEQQSLCLVGHGFGSDVDSQKQRFYKGDILFGKLRPYFRKVIVAPFDGICSTDIWVVKPKAGIDRNFLFYWMASEEFIASSTHASEGGRMPRAKWDWVSKFELKNFTPKEQSAIGTTLGALDQKIAANRALSETLENVAREIFKSWFIDFDPVKAKMAGNKPAGMDDATAALFPDSMEESELGLIPNGWSISNLRNHLEVTKGKSYKSSELEESDTALVTLKSFKRGGGYRFDGLKPFSGEFKPEQIVEPGELIVSFTDVTQAADIIGKPAIVFYNPQFSRLVASLDVGIVRPVGNEVGKHYLYQLFSTPAFKNHIDGYTNGTTVLHLGKGALEDFTVALPGSKIMSKYEMFASTALGQSQALYLENLTLEAIRDSLLPRLISGDLQIPEEMLAS